MGVLGKDMGRGNLRSKGANLEQAWGSAMDKERIEEKGAADEVREEQVQVT